MEEITVVVVDDHPLFCQGVADVLQLETDITVVGRAGEGRTGLDLIRQLRPCVAVVDVNLPHANGQQIARQVAAEKLPTRVILLTAYDDAEQKRHAMQAGAAAYCTKDIRPEELLGVVRQVAAGAILWDQARANTCLVEHGQGDGRAIAQWSFDQTLEQNQPLSNREMQVLSFVTYGMSNKEIARLLGISHQTVKNHVTAILRKIGVDDRIQAAIYALRKGWVRLYEKESHTQE